MTFITYEQNAHNKDKDLSHGPEKVSKRGDLQEGCPGQIVPTEAAHLNQVECAVATRDNWRYVRGFREAYASFKSIIKLGHKTAWRRSQPGGQHRIIMVAFLPTVTYLPSQKVDPFPSER